MIMLLRWFLLLNRLELLFFLLLLLLFPTNALFVTIYTRSHRLQIV